jgi:hypothetical protein
MASKSSSRSFGGGGEGGGGQLLTFQTFQHGSKQEKKNRDMIIQRVIKSTAPDSTVEDKQQLCEFLKEKEQDVLKWRMHYDIHFNPRFDDDSVNKLFFPTFRQINDYQDGNDLLEIVYRIICNMTNLDNEQKYEVFFKFTDVIFHFVFWTMVHDLCAEKKQKKESLDENLKLIRDLFPILTIGEEIKQKDLLYMIYKQAILQIRITTFLRRFKKDYVQKGISSKEMMMKIALVMHRFFEDGMGFFKQYYSDTYYITIQKIIKELKDGHYILSLDLVIETIQRMKTDLKDKPSSDNLIGLFIGFYFVLIESFFSREYRFDLRIPTMILSDKIMGYIEGNPEIRYEDVIQEMENLSKDIIKKGQQQQKQASMNAEALVSEQQSQKAERIQNAQRKRKEAQDKSVLSTTFVQISPDKRKTVDIVLQQIKESMAMKKSLHSPISDDEIMEKYIDFHRSKINRSIKGKTIEERNKILSQYPTYIVPLQVSEKLRIFPLKGVKTNQEEVIQILKKVYKTNDSDKKNPDFRYPKYLQERLSMILQSNGMDPNLTTLSLAQKSNIQDSQKKYKTNMRPVFKLLNTTKVQELNVPDLSTMQIQYLSQKYRKGQLDIDEDWAQQISMMPKNSRGGGGEGGGGGV